MKLVHEVLFNGKKVADIKELQNAGYIDENLQLTTMGENVLVRFYLIEANFAAFVKRAKDKNAEKDAERA